MSISQLRSKSDFIHGSTSRYIEGYRFRNHPRWLQAGEIPLIVLPLLKKAAADGRALFFVERGGYPFALAGRLLANKMGLDVPIISHKIVGRASDKPSIVENIEQYCNSLFDCREFTNLFGLSARDKQNFLQTAKDWIPEQLNEVYDLFALHCKENKKGLFIRVRLSPRGVTISPSDLLVDDNSIGKELHRVLVTLPR
ncbi:hypothetical protein HFN86_36050 [Rhizobium laguerreae]|uniref:hypothetical protein n=1 Tax=Rhizobium laguerreae TaxID=1076926 RepID=UPI001C908AF5|nr:hypothetical protein [Rhizobium laguerreae]MBY3425519.1 hypothetical protein [Rhizobium laguerreae]